ncbi:hypothetical protein Bca101_026405 [Brassica carinata]
MLQDDSPVGESQTCSTAGTVNSKHLLLNQEYIKRGTTCKGTIFGLSSVLFNDNHPSDSVPAALNRKLDMEMQICGLENLTQEIKSDFLAVKSDVQTFKTDFNEAMAKTQSGLDMILKFLQPQVSNPADSTAQPNQSQASPEGQGQGQGQAPSPAHDKSPGQGESQPQHLFTTDHADLDRWCSQLGL